MRSSPGTDHNTALLAEKCQSFLDNIIAGFAGARAFHDPMPQISTILRFESCHLSLSFPKMSSGVDSHYERESSHHLG